MIDSLIHKVLAEIDAEIARLEKAKALLSPGAPTKRGPGRPKGTATEASPKKKTGRKLSAETIKKMREAQSRRWAAQKKAAK